MNLNDYQREAARTLNGALDDRARLVDAAAGLSEEAGEVLGLVRKHVYMNHDLDRQHIVKELGDVLWCITAVASTIGVTLDEIGQSNLAKLRTRYPAGYTDEASRTRNDTAP